MFFIFAGCTVGYFLIVVFLLPETKGKTLEEIEGIFAGKAMKNGGSAGINAAQPLLVQARQFEDSHEDPD